MRYREKRRVNKILRVSVMILLVSIFSTILNINVYGSTVNDVRDLVGKQRISEEELKNELEGITKDAAMTGLHNIAADMNSHSSGIIKKTKNEIDILNLKSKISEQENAVYERFISNAPANEVLQEKSRLDNYIYEFNKLKEFDIDINIEPISDNWVEDYKNAQEKIEKYTDKFDIGQLGSEMKPPIKWDLELLYPYGQRYNPRNLKEVEMHSGIDIKAPLLTNVLSQWNGIVSNVYKSNKYGNIVEIEHGKGLKTKYSYLEKVFVNVGDEVEQYQVIGVLGKTDGYTEPHLHFEVYLDNEVINPILLYGENGKQALLNWAKDKPNISLEQYGINDIKDFIPSNNSNKTSIKVSDIVPGEYTDKIEDDSIEIIIPTLPNDFETPDPGTLN